MQKTKDGFFSGKNILITGGLGFIGSNLAIELAGLGARLTLVDSLLPMCGGNPFNIDPVKEKVKVETADIREKEKMEKLVAGQEIIFNLAGQLSHVDSMTDPLNDLDINCRGNLTLLEACRTKCPDAKIVYTGTRGQYGKAQYLPVDEKHPLFAMDVNGINKTAGEQYHLLYNKVYGMETVSLRLTNTYGPRHQMRNSKQGFMNWFIRIAMDGGTIRIFGDGSQRRDYNYVDDVVSALLFAAESGSTKGEVFNLGGEHASILEIAKTIVSSAGTGSFEAVPYDGNHKIVEVGDYIADYGKIKKLGWKPRTALEAGVKKTVSFYKKHKEMYW